MTKLDKFIGISFYLTLLLGLRTIKYHCECRYCGKVKRF